MRVTTGKNSFSVILQLYKPVNQHTRQLIYLNTSFFDGWSKLIDCVVEGDWRGRGGDELKCFNVCQDDNDI